MVLNFEYLKPAQYLVDAIVHDCKNTLDWFRIVYKEKREIKELEKNLGECTIWCLWKRKDGRFHEDSSKE